MCVQVAVIKEYGYDTVMESVSQILTDPYYTWSNSIHNSAGCYVDVTTG